jgi:hypothetical protein
VTSRLGFSLSILMLMLATGSSCQLAGERGWYGRKARLAFKGLTTAFAAVLALYAYSETLQAYALVMAGGIILCASADVLLDLHFLSGTACFAAGHLAYIASFWMADACRHPPCFCSSSWQGYRRLPRFRFEKGLISRFYRFTSTPWSSA